MERSSHFTKSNWNWMRDVTHHSPDTYQNWRKLIENRLSRHAWLKTNRRYPMTSRTHNSYSFIAELKHNLMNKCTTVSDSKLFRCFLVPAWADSTRYHNTLSNIIGSVRRSQYIYGFMHLVFAENLSLSQANDLGPQIHTTQYYIAELYPVLKRWWGVYAILIVCWGITCLITLLSYNQLFYFAEAYSASLVYCANSNLETLLTYSLFNNIADLHPFSLHWGAMAYLNTLLSVFGKRCRHQSDSSTTSPNSTKAFSSPSDWWANSSFSDGNSGNAFLLSTQVQILFFGFLFQKPRFNGQRLRIKRFLCCWILSCMLLFECF